MLRTSGGRHAAGRPGGGGSVRASVPPAGPEERRGRSRCEGVSATTAPVASASCERWEQPCPTAGRKVSRALPWRPAGAGLRETRGPVVSSERLWAL